MLELRTTKQALKSTNQDPMFHKKNKKNKKLKERTEKGSLVFFLSLSQKKKKVKGILLKKKFKGNLHENNFIFQMFLAGRTHLYKVETHKIDCFD